jgi:hypothetical protein
MDLALLDRDYMSCANIEDFQLTIGAVVISDLLSALEISSFTKVGIVSMTVGSNEELMVACMKETSAPAQNRGYRGMTYIRSRI